jgi:hypothetical protein
MKKPNFTILILLIVIVAFIATQTSAETIGYIANGSGWEKYIEDLGISGESAAYEYYNPEGIDATVALMMGDLGQYFEQGHELILMGYSQGGVAARRLAQEMAGDNRIKGYIVMSSPNYGNRLVNPVWAFHGLAVIGANCGYALGAILKNSSCIKDYDLSENNLLDYFYSELPDQSKKLLLGMEERSKVGIALNDASEEYVAFHYGLPMIEALFEGTRGEGQIQMVSSVFYPSGNSLKNLEPDCDFMNDLNDPDHVEREIDNMRRVALKTRGGNIYDYPAVWERAEAAIEYTQAKRVYYWNKYRRTSRVRVKRRLQYWTSWRLYRNRTLQLTSFPDYWGYACVGRTGDTTSHDCLVPYNDTFNGIHLSQDLPGNRGPNSDDMSRTLDHVTHFDVNYPYDYLSNLYGINGSKKAAADEIRNNTRDAWSHTTGTD